MDERNDQLQDECKQQLVVPDALAQPRVLTPDEVRAVAGGPWIWNGR